MYTKLELQAPISIKQYWDNFQLRLTNLVQNNPVEDPHSLYAKNIKILQEMIEIAKTMEEGRFGGNLEQKKHEILELAPNFGSDNLPSIDDTRSYMFIQMYVDHLETFSSVTSGYFFVEKGINFFGKPRVAEDQKKLQRKLENAEQYKPVVSQKTVQETKVSKQEESLQEPVPSNLVQETNVLKQKESLQESVPSNLVQETSVSKQEESLQESVTTRLLDLIKNFEILQNDVEELEKGISIDGIFEKNKKELIENIWQRSQTLSGSLELLDQELKNLEANLIVKKGEIANLQSELEYKKETNKELKSNLTNEDAKEIYLFLNSENRLTTKQQKQWTTSDSPVLVLSKILDELINEKEQTVNQKIKILGEELSTLDSKIQINNEKSQRIKTDIKPLSDKLSGYLDIIKTHNELPLSQNPSNKSVVMPAKKTKMVEVKRESSNNISAFFTKHMKKLEEDLQILHKEFQGAIREINKIKIPNWSVKR